MENSSNTAKLTSLALITLMVGMIASFGLSEGEISTELSDSKEFYSHNSNNIPGSDSGSVFSNSTMALMEDTTCVVAHDNTLRCWGKIGNGNAQSGYAAVQPTPGSDAWGFSPFWPAQASIDHNVTAEWVAIDGSALHSCGITAAPVTTPIDNSAYNLLCWGEGDNFNLDCYGNCHIPERPNLPLNTHTVEVATGFKHTCSISPIRGQAIDDSSIYCWGRNWDGQLGQGNFYDSRNPSAVNLPQGSQPVSIVSGFSHTCTLLSGGDAMCWGGNGAGQLGTISLVNSSSPSPVRITPSGSSIAQIVAGGNSTCALMDDGSVRCWGSNWQGILGDGTTTSTWSTSTSVDLPTGRTAISIDMHYQNACAILDDNSLFCWGSNNVGQLGDITTGTSYDSDGGRISKIPVEIDLGHGVASVTVGVNHTCAITLAEDLHCWGKNSWAQIGIGMESFSVNSTSGLVDLGPTDWACTGNCLPNDFIPNSTIPSQAPGLSDRDPDGDGMMSLFDPYPLIPNCDPGYYATDNTGCLAADPGHYVPSSGQNHQVPCPVGTYQPNSGQSGCLVASPGYYTNVSSAAVQQFPCHAGTYQPNSGQFAENWDDASEYTRPIDGESTIVAEICITNSPGHYSDHGSPDEVPCPPGTYQPLSGYTYCIDTTPGYYTADSGNTDETPCEGGTYQPNGGRSACFLASPGYKASPNSLQQDLCTPGTYSDEFGLEVCKLADPGYYVTAFGATYQIACLPGQHQPTSGQTTCLSTSPGYYTSDPGTGFQIACDSGTFESQGGATSCSGVTEPGHYSPPGSESQVECEPGTYAPYNGMAECLLAEPGNYVPVNVSVDQIPCPPGQYQPDSGMDSCLITEPGHYSDEGSSDQSECQPGTFQAQSEATSCDDAEPGHFVSTQKASEQTPCPPGEYQGEFSSTACFPVEQGTYSSESGASEPSLCPPGTYQSLTGQTECILADRGYYASEMGATFQTPCEKGTYQPESGNSECLDASPGYFVSKTGQTSQESCLPGNFQPLPGAVGCIAAEPGNFVADSGASSQTTCPSGETQTQYGMTSCEEGDQLVMIVGGVAALAIVLMVLFMQSQKKPKGRGRKGAKRRKQAPRPRKVREPSEEE